MLLHAPISLDRVTSLLYLASQTTSCQTDLCDFIHPTDGVLVFRQVSGTSVGGLNGRLALENRRQAGCTNVEFAELVVRNLDGVSGIAVTLREDGTRLGNGVEVSNWLTSDPNNLD
jgi:hypothetical protein